MTTETNQKTYSVTLPVVLELLVSVEAASESEALEKALGLDVILDASGDGSPEVIQWEAHRQIVQGNVFHGSINEPLVEEEE